MKFLPLIGKQLKDDDVIDILESYDAEVIYDFDRLHENIPDVYWAACKSQGVQFCFNAQQALCTIFIYLEGSEGFVPIETAEIEDVPLFSSTEDVEAHCSATGMQFVKGGRPDGLGKSWGRMDGPDRAVHYEFVNERLARITIMSPEECPK